MGLDQFFFKCKKGVKPADEETDLQEIGYFRKANFLRKWLIDNTGYKEDGNLIYHKLDKEDIGELLMIAAHVFTYPSVAEEFLPTQDGFFFGNTEYDEDYYYKVGCLIKTAAAILADTDWEKEDVYYHEWW